MRDSSEGIHSEMDEDGLKPGKTRQVLLLVHIVPEEGGT